MPHPHTQSMSSSSSITSATLPSEESTFLDSDSVSLSSYSISISSTKSAKRPIQSFFRKLSRKVSRPFSKQRKGNDEAFTFVNVNGQWEREETRIHYDSTGSQEDVKSFYSPDSSQTLPQSRDHTPTGSVIVQDSRDPPIESTPVVKEKRLKPKKSFMQAFIEKKRKRDNLPEIILTPATPVYGYQDAPSSERFDNFSYGDHDSHFESSEPINSYQVPEDSVEEIVSDPGHDADTTDLSTADLGPTQSKTDEKYPPSSPSITVL